MSDNAGASSKAAPQRVDIKYLIKALVKYNASDLHLKVDRAPIFRINGRLVPAKMTELTRDQVESMIYSLLSDRLRRDLEDKRQVDLSFMVPNFGRFRCNAFYQRNVLSAVIRMIPFNIPSLDDLGIPEVLKELCERPKGLILVTGATGSGKSTTLAGMVQYINEHHHVHILTMEDPIEFMFRDIKASITQREVGSDIHTFQDGLISGLRQDPDVIVIGELRDHTMIQAALTAAETGHLVLATLHTNDARSTIDRVVDVFAPEAKNQVRIQLATNLIGVISQQLLVRSDGTGRVPACEIMVKSPAIENYILRNELHLIPDAIRTSNTYYKMQSMNKALLKLIRSGAITHEEGMRASPSPDELRLSLEGISASSGAYGQEGSEEIHTQEIPLRKYG